MDTDKRYAISRWVGRGRGSEQRVLIITPWSPHKVLMDKALESFQELDPAGVYAIQIAPNLATVMRIDPRR